MASPFPATPPRDEAELIRPAVDGTRRVLEASVRAGVRRVVMTSSLAAVTAGRSDDGERRRTEEELERPGPDRPVREEQDPRGARAAWDFAAQHPELELAVINPGLVLGPLQHAAAGNRYICAGENVWFGEIAQILGEEFGPQGYRVPRRRMPYWMLWAAGRFDREVRLGLDFVGSAEQVSADKVRRELGWSMRPVRETVVDTGRSVIDLGLVRARS
jgi:dihydroflavonol-4-reductase